MRKAKRTLPNQPIGFAHADAAECAGVPPAEFGRLVRTGAMPPPCLAGDALIWRRAEIDEARRAQRGGFSGGGQ